MKFFQNGILESLKLPGPISIFQFPFPILDFPISILALSACTARANRFVWHIAFAAAHAVVNAQLAYGTESLVVKCRNTESGSQLFVELAQILQVRGQRRNFQAVIG